MAKTTKFTLPEIGLSASTKLPKTKGKWSLRPRLEAQIPPLIQINPNAPVQR